MGHLINPVGFRLGTCRFWNVVWMNSLKNKKMYSYQIGIDFILLDFFERMFNMKTVLSMGFIFSHIKIFKNKNKIFVFVYFLEGTLDQKFELFYNIFRKWSLKLIKKYKYKKLKYLKKQKNKKRDIIKIELLKSKNKFFDFKKFKHIKSRNICFLKNKCFLKFFDLKNKYNFIKLISRSIINNQNNISEEDLLKKSKNKIFNLKYLKKLTQRRKKKKLIYYRIFNQFKMFFLKLLIKQKNQKLMFLNDFFYGFITNKLQFKLSLYNLQKTVIFYILNCLCTTPLKIKFLFIKLNLFYKFNTINKKNLFRFYIKKQNRLLRYLKDLKVKNNFEKFVLLKNFIKSFIENENFIRNYPKFLVFVRNLWFYYIKFFLNTHRKFFFPMTKQTFFSFKYLNNNQVSSEIIARYICIRLQQRFYVKQILNTLVPYLMQNRNYYGFKVACAGRFSKNEIAVYYLRKSGSMHLASFNNYIDYYFNEVILKYSICSIKVWINRKSFLFRKLTKFNS